MLNRYPAWKNILILLVVIWGLLYSIPNLYPDDEAIQISNATFPVSEADLAGITSAL